MAYLGRKGAAAALTSADIPDNSITAAKIVEGTITVGDIGTNAVGADELANDAVDTNAIADDAVTLAKMAGGTDGNIISYDASGDPVAIATGTDGQVLTSTGAGSPPAFEAIPSSGPVCCFAGWNDDAPTTDGEFVGYPLNLTRHTLNTSYFTKSTSTFTTVTAGAYMCNLNTGTKLTGSENIKHRIIHTPDGGSPSTYFQTSSYGGGGSTSTAQWQWYSYSVMIDLDVDDTIQFGAESTTATYLWNNGLTVGQLSLWFMHT